MEKVVRVRDVVNSLNLKAVAGKEALDNEIILAEIYNPGLELTGWIVDNKNENFNGIHIFGDKEAQYLDSLNKKVREHNITNYLSCGFPCVIFPKEVKIPKDFLRLADLLKKSVLISNKGSKQLIKKVRSFLNEAMGPELVLNHFTFLEIFGTGVLISGNKDFRVGTVIELLRKKHRLVADGMVNVRRISNDYIIGKGVGNVDKRHHFIELSSNNRLEITNFFGIGAMKPVKAIELIVKLSNWDETFPYDRIGDSTKKQYLLGIEIPTLILPIKKGRNVSTIIEVAAMNRRLQKREKASSVIFMDKLKKLIKKNEAKPVKGELVDIREIKRKFKAVVLSKNENSEEINIISGDIYRPSIEFNKGFKNLKSIEKKVHVISDMEIHYLQTLPQSRRDRILDEYFNISFPCLVISSASKVEFPDLIKRAAEKQVVVLQTKKEVGSLVIDLSEFLDARLAPNESSHGVFLEVFGVGVFLTGRSGIGKSETALELIHRGHRLISDDIVKFKKMKDGRLLGSAAKIPYFMEIRGLGIIDVKTLYGLGSVKHSKELDLVIELMEVNEGESLDFNYRESAFNILGKNVKKVDFYVSPGRNVSSIIEILAMRYRQKYFSGKGVNNQ